MYEFAAKDASMRDVNALMSGIVPARLFELTSRFCSVVKLLEPLAAKPLPRLVRAWPFTTTSFSAEGALQSEEGRVWPS